MKYIRLFCGLFLVYGFHANLAGIRITDDLEEDFLKKKQNTLVGNIVEKYNYPSAEWPMAFSEAVMIADGYVEITLVLVNDVGGLTNDPDSKFDLDESTFTKSYFEPMSKPYPRAHRAYFDHHRQKVKDMVVFNQLGTVGLDAIDQERERIKSASYLNIIDEIKKVAAYFKQADMILEQR